jgi:hypothetical protein
MMGGLSHAEIRSLKNLEEFYGNKFIFIIGADHFSSPSDYLENLYNMEEPLG